MNVAIIRHAHNTTHAAIVEWPDGVLAIDILRNWIGRQGLDPDRIAHLFSVDFAPVIEWESLKKTFEPIPRK